MMRILSMTFQSFSSFQGTLNAKTKRKNIFEGRCKNLLDDPFENVIVLQFKDTIPTLQNNGDCIEVPGKAAINNRLSEMFFLRLANRGIANHFLSRISMTEQRVHTCDPLPFKVMIHNVATADFAYRLGIEEHFPLPEPIIEFVFPLKDGNYSIIHDKHIDVFQMASPAELDYIVNTTHRVNDFLSGQFLSVGLQLLSLRLDFGRHFSFDYFMESELLLIDELTPDRMGILDLETNQRLDRSVVLTQACPQDPYRIVAERFRLLKDGGPVDIQNMKQPQESAQ
ncbi:MAG: Phosphoribosylaminoimidazole-succinocarboxamide synthase [Holosporales bacterium]